MKIAVIGPADFMHNITFLAEQIKDIEIVPYVYSRPEEAGDVTRNLKPCDVVFYSGGLPFYFSAEARRSLTVPALFMEQDEMVIATTLLSILYKQKIPVGQISIDLYDSSFFYNVLKDIAETGDQYHVVDFVHSLPSSFNMDEIVQFHQDLYDSGKTKLALTSIYSVYDRLQELGIPAMRMIDPSKAMIRGLMDAKVEAELVKKHSATIAVCHLSFSAASKQPNKVLTSFSNAIKGSIHQRSEGSYSLFSTRGDIETMMRTDGLRHFLLDWEIPVAIGFGYGETAADAEQHAKIAHRFASHEKASCGYILTEKKELYGPYPDEAKVQSLKNNHPELLKLAKAIKISPANLSKIVQFSQSRQSLQFTAADLSNYLQVTRRSAERMIKKLVDHGSIKIVGEEMTYLQGRPRALYELNIPVYN